MAAALTDKARLSVGDHVALVYPPGKHTEMSQELSSLHVPSSLSSSLRGQSQWCQCRGHHSHDRRRDSGELWGCGPAPSQPQYSSFRDSVGVRCSSSFTWPHPLSIIIIQLLLDWCILLQSLSSFCLFIWLFLPHLRPTYCSYKAATVITPAR